MMTTVGVSCQGKGKGPDASKKKKAFEIVEQDILCYSKIVFILLSINFKAKDRTNLKKYQFLLNKELPIPYLLDEFDKFGNPLLRKAIKLLNYMKW